MKNVNKKKKKEDRVFSTGSAPSGGHEEGFPLPHEEGIKKRKKKTLELFLPDRQPFPLDELSFPPSLSLSLSLSLSDF